jgi:hypothetical protein
VLSVQLHTFELHDIIYDLIPPKRMRLNCVKNGHYYLSNEPGISDVSD